jgi:rhodanese-related sulfurtransferase
MADSKTIGAGEAFQKAWTDKVPLVNSYDNPQDQAKFDIAGATPYPEFKAQAAQLSKDSEILFYCGCEHDELATQRAQEFAQQGFTNAKVVQGGYQALAQQSKQAQKQQGASS